MFDGVAEALGEIEELDLDALAPEELSEAVLEMQRLRGRLEAAEAKVIGRWDAERCWGLEGARTGPSWLSVRCRLPIGIARQRVRHARALRELPLVADAWAQGEIDRSHITTMLAARTPRSAGAFERDHKQLLDAARSWGFPGFKRFCDMWALTVDPDGAEAAADAEREGREVHLSQSFGGVWFGRMSLDRISGTIVHTTLSLIERELFEADWADARERLGREPTGTELARSSAQRRADALVAMAERARAAPADGRRPVPLFSVLVGYETFAGPLLELFNRSVITPGAAARWLGGADIERIVFDGPSRVIDVGAKRRFFRGALRRAIEIRDRTCFHPLCDEVPERPEIDHITEASRGGPTTQANGRLGCGFHNRQRNQHDGGDGASPTIHDDDAGPDPPEG